MAEGEDTTVSVRSKDEVGDLVSRSRRDGDNSGGGKLTRAHAPRQQQQQQQKKQQQQQQQQQQKKQQQQQQQLTQQQLKQQQQQLYHAIKTLLPTELKLKIVEHLREDEELPPVDSCRLPRPRRTAAIQFNPALATIVGQRLGLHSSEECDVQLPGEAGEAGGKAWRLLHGQVERAAKAGFFAARRQVRCNWVRIDMADMTLDELEEVRWNLDVELDQRGSQRGDFLTDWLNNWVNAGTDAGQIGVWLSASEVDAGWRQTPSEGIHGVRMGGKDTDWGRVEDIEAAIEEALRGDEDWPRTQMPCDGTPRELVARRGDGASRPGDYRWYYPVKEVAALVCRLKAECAWAKHVFLVEEYFGFDWVEYDVCVFDTDTPTGNGFVHPYQRSW